NAASATPNAPATSSVIPRYWPAMICRTLNRRSLKKARRTNASSMFVDANAATARSTASIMCSAPLMSWWGWASLYHADGNARHPPDCRGALPVDQTDRLGDAGRTLLAFDLDRHLVRQLHAA